MQKYIYDGPDEGLFYESKFHKYVVRRFALQLVSHTKRSDNLDSITHVYGLSNGQLDYRIGMTFQTTFLTKAKKPGEGRTTISLFNNSNGVSIVEEIILREHKKG
ncbi:hypothetical protein J4455_00350 [Candidatus Woesearchaeota archaeon]|nr:hypothetical protein [Candidatus Woesearchaeota archaeon]